MDRPPTPHVPPVIPPEGPETEWKERLPATIKVARTLSAFANGIGGRLWVGVRDDGEQCGIANPDAVKGRIREAASMVEPEPNIEFRTHAIARGFLVEAHVRGEGDTPAVVYEPDGQKQVYMRDADQTIPADRDDVRWMERVTGAKMSLTDQDRKILLCLSERGRLHMDDLCRVAFMGQRTVKRRLVELRYGGLVLELEGRRFALTPKGHARVDGF